MKIVKYLLFLLIFIQHTYAQQKYELSFSDGSGLNFDIIFSEVNNNLEIELKGTQGFEVYNFHSNDSISENLNKIINEKLRKSHKVKILKSKYSETFKHLDEIYKKAKPIKISNVKVDTSINYCNFDVVLVINDKYDVYSEHSSEVKENYHYIIDVIKNEFNDFIVEDNLNLILVELDYYSHIISIDPLLVEVFHRKPYIEKDVEEQYNFPKAEEIFLILKGDLKLSRYNVDYLAKNYKNVFFIIDYKLYKCDFEAGSDGPEESYYAIDYHLQELENKFSKNVNEIKFKYSEKSTFTFFDKSEGSFLSKRIRSYEDYNQEYIIYIFENYIDALNIGVKVFEDFKGYEINVWDIENEDYPRFNSLDFYEINKTKNNFKLKVNKIENELKGTFSGVLYNESTGEKIKIKEGSFVIDLNQKY